MQIIINESTIHIDDIAGTKPIFAKKGKEVIGMVVFEDESWILRTGKNVGYSGFWSDLKDLIENTPEYTFHVSLKTNEI